MKGLTLPFLLLYIQLDYDIIVCLDACLHIQNALNGSDAEITENSTCLPNRFCDRDYTITLIHIPPFSEEHIFEQRIDACCQCARYKMKQKFANVTELTKETINDTDFIYPVPGSSSKNTLFGMHFIPLIDVDEFFYITPRAPTVYNSMMKKMKKVYPIIIICILMTIISGFLTWIIETWFNKEEFPRPFLIGWFEGCWWSFISMTTVGYGDKTPRSVPGRIYAVAWILTDIIPTKLDNKLDLLDITLEIVGNYSFILGITIFGILTGLLTAAIQDAEKIPKPTLTNAKVGALKYRTIDLLFLAKSGGRLVQRGDYVDSFETDIISLIGRLKKKRSQKDDGIILDKLTYNYLIRKYIPELKKNDFIDFKGEKRETARENVDYLLKKTSFTTMVYPGRSMTYGVLVRDKQVYDYFKDAIIDNKQILEAFLLLKSKAAADAPEHKALFEIDSPYFINVVVFLSVAMAGVLTIGSFIEMMRLRRSTCKRNIHHQA